jgi:cytochrome c-type biogenesis protein CcmH
VNPALAFILSAMGLVLVVITVLAWSLWRGSRQGAERAAHLQDAAAAPAQANAAVYREQLAELDHEYQLGNLNDEELQIARDELTRRLLEDVGPDALTDEASADTAQTATAVVWRKPWILISCLIFLVPVAAMSVYAVLGQPAALDPMALKQGVDHTAEVTPEKLTEMATALTRRLQDEPNNVEGWVMLGRVQRARGQFAEADEALRKALTLSQDDNLAIERAEVLAQKNGGNFAGEPWAIIQRVLTADPHHLNALFLAGSASYSEENFRSALRFWERAREVVPADSPDAPELDRAIAEARDKMGLPSSPPRAAEATTGAPVNAQARISGRVSLIKELADKAAPNDTVFVYATPVTGSRMPVAIVRTTVAQLPFDFVLDDSTSMNPSAKLSSMSEVTVRVRISKSGQAMVQPGDLGVSVSPVKLGSSGLNLMVREALQ